MPWCADEPRLYPIGCRRRHLPRLESNQRNSNKVKLAQASAFEKDLPSARVVRVSDTMGASELSDTAAARSSSSSRPRQ